MKKIRCTFGTETVDEALYEVEMYKKFPHRNIIKVLVRINERKPSQCLDRTNTIRQYERTPAHNPSQIKQKQFTSFCHSTG